MNQHQIFNDTFESSWKDFDVLFRKKLLDSFRQLGSLHRLSCGHEEANTEYGRRFYEALEQAIIESKFIRKLKSALIIDMPTSFDDLDRIFKMHTLYPLHSFYLLILYVHDHPMRAFFSGRDRPLPLNTLTLQFHQSLSDPLPTAVDYELEFIRLDRWLKLASDHGAVPDSEVSAGFELMATKPRPQHYWTDLRWVWHFGWSGSISSSAG
jgi:hypothetical protein